MSRITKMAFQLLILIVLIPLSSCAIVTVNIYFPAEEVREAYKSLEEELLKSPEETPKQENVPEKEAPKGQPQSLRKYPDKPQLESRRIIVLKRRFDLAISTPAWAQGNLAAQITSEIRKMPEVVQAFRNRGKRLASITNLLSQGKVGEGNMGLLVKRGNLTEQETADFTAENSDRQVIIKGMASAIVKINKLEMTSENVNRVLPQAAEQFAEVRKEEAKPGWDIQLPNGSWQKK
ncbi:MAG: DUF1318 domain-containing protein [Deltaproteobacteria bacterium]|nr:DUF1318 domain-containing protein [Deltaproteobacteria bacterium]